MKCYSYQYTL